MKFKTIQSLFSSAIMSLCLVSQVSANEVMGWVPSDQSKRDQVMGIMESNPHIVAGLNRVGLQFWHPASDGSIIYSEESSEWTFSDTETEAFVSYFHSKNIQVLATIYNAKSGVGWSWDIFHYALDNPDAFTTAAVALVQKHNLDGIDVDLELTSTPTTAIQTKYKTLLTKLSNALKPLGKVLTVDTFHSDCYNIPNKSWWGDWVGLVDHIHSMGYQDLYEGNGTALCNESNVFKFSSQQASGVSDGFSPDQISMGLPGYFGTWGSGGLGTTPQAHIQEILALPQPASMAIWDLAFTGGSNWTSTETWSEAAKLKAIGEPIVPTTGTTSLVSSTLQENFNTPLNLQTTSNQWQPRPADIGKTLRSYSVQGDLLQEQEIQSTDLIELQGVDHQVRILRVY